MAKLQPYKNGLRTGKSLGIAHSQDSANLVWFVHFWSNSESFEAFIQAVAAHVIRHRLRAWLQILSTMYIYIYTLVELSREFNYRNLTQQYSRIDLCIYIYTAIIYRLACGYQRTWSMTENEGFGTRTASLLIKVKVTCWTQNILVTTWWLKGYTLLFFLHPFLTKVSQFDNLLILEGAYNFLYERQSNLAQFFPPQRMSIFTVHVVS